MSFDIMTDEQLGGMSVDAKSEIAISHILARISTDKTLGYLCGLGGQSFSYLTEALAALTGKSVETIRIKYLPTEAENPSKTYAPTPINSINSYGEGAEESTAKRLLEVPFDDDQWIEYLELQSRVKALCESFASKECATAPHLASSSQHLDAIQAKLEKEAA